MTRTGQEAIDYARSRVGTTMPDSGLCLQFVRTCFDVGSYYYSAIDAWNAAVDKHPGDRNPPPAVPLYFLTPSQYDHVVFSCSPGEIISTFNDQIRSYSSISSIEANFDGTYLGWAGDINRVDIYDGEDDDMPSAEEVAAAVWAYGINRPGAPVSDAGTFLADTRVIVDQGTAGAVWSYPGAAPADPATAVWASILGDANGTDYARNWLLAARKAPEVNAKLDDLLDEPVTSGRTSVDLAVVALLVLIAVVGGVAIGLLSETRDGVVAGIAALIGGLLAVVLRNLPRRSRSGDA